MIELLSRIKEQLFDAPNEVKAAFNNIVNYFSRSTGKSAPGFAVVVRNSDKTLHIMTEKEADSHYQDKEWRVLNYYLDRKSAEDDLKEIRKIKGKSGDLLYK